MYDRLEELALKAISLRNQYNETMSALSVECGKYAYDDHVKICDVMGDDEILVEIEQEIDKEYYSFHGMAIHDFVNHVRICGFVDQEAYLALRKIYSSADDFKNEDNA